MSIVTSNVHQTKKVFSSLELRRIKMVEETNER
jgi:hypothetical protein